MPYVYIFPLLSKLLSKNLQIGNIFVKHYPRFVIQDLYHPKHQNSVSDTVKILFEGTEEFRLMDKILFDNLYLISKEPTILPLGKIVLPFGVEQFDDFYNILLLKIPDKKIEIQPVVNYITITNFLMPVDELLYGNPENCPRRLLIHLKNFFYEDSVLLPTEFIEKLFMNNPPRGDDISDPLFSSKIFLKCFAEKIYAVYRGPKNWDEMERRYFFQRYKKNIKELGYDVEEMEKTEYLNCT